MSRAAEINTRYAGKHVAIIGDMVVASGESPLEVYKRAKKSHPHGRPLLAYVPKDETLVLFEEGVGGVVNGQDSYSPKGLQS